MQDDFEQLLKNDRYQIFLMICPANMPFSFATHPWLVINAKGSLSRLGIGRDSVGTRWEVLFESGQGHLHWGHLHKNLFPPFQGIAIFPYSTKYFWKGRLLGYIEGRDNSTAQKMAAFIESSAQTYPYRNTYSLIGPNSNTYVQWILNHFPNSGLHLPWNAFGKNFKKCGANTMNDASRAE